MAANILNNRYRILQTLAEGGFGRTYLAEDTHMPSKRRCVIKQLKPITQNAQTQQLVQERFQREGAVLEELGEHHRQIPQLYAYFAEGGEFYLVQEWVEGSTLTETVRHNGRLTETEVTALLASLLPVLDFIHSRHIVHRDIKPDNIILRASDGVPMLIDFGAVKEAVNAAGVGSKASIVIGTPGFIASEQAAGHPTYASDLYSLGLTAIFALCGKFPQDLTQDGRTGEMLWRQDVSVSNATLAAVLERSIRHSTRDRFASAEEMLAALQSGIPNAGIANAGQPDRFSTMPTVAVSPGMPTQPNAPSPGTKPTVPVASPKITSPDAIAPVAGSNTVGVQPKRGGIPGCLLWGLALGGFLGAGWALAGGFLGSLFAPESPTSEPISSQPVPSTAPPTEPTPKQTSKPTLSTPPEPPLEVPSEIEPEPPLEAPSATEPEPPLEAPSATEAEASVPEETSDIPRTPDVDVAPTPAPEEEEAIPTLPSESDTAPPVRVEEPVEEEVSESDTSEPEGTQEEVASAPSPDESFEGTANASIDIPGFAPGTQRRAIEFALGEPTRESSGLWGNTQAVLYADQIPGQVDLGYLFDPGSGRLRQTEATFDPSMDIEILSGTLEDMTSNNLSTQIEKGLTAVYRGKVDRFDFTSGRRDRLKGTIQRSEDDRIYLAVWEADLH